MNLASLISGFKLKGKSLSQVNIVIQGDAVYISSPASDSGAPDRFPIDSSWESTLSSALSTGDFRKTEACVILASQFYQTYQIEKPEIPQEEWPGALPFLLKDLVTEKVTDIVADGYPLPDGKRAQTYVLSKAVLSSIRQAIEQTGAILSRIVPEDEAWGYAQNEFPNFMLLYRSEKANFKIGAYTEKQNRFQRVIRGVTPPLTETAMGEFQLDSLALELQRSTDYLSSQIRDVSFNHLYVCCDEETLPTLVQELSERMDIKVMPLTEGETVRCGEVLAQVAKQLPQSGINLYPVFLKPQKERLNLTTLAVSWAAVVLLMTGMYGYLAIQNANDEARLQQLRSEMESLNLEIKSLQSKLSAHKSSPSKIAAAERLKTDIKDKEKSLAAIYQFNSDEQAGYSGVMHALAKLESDNISISYIIMDQNQLNLAGMARTPGSVPRWVKKFKGEVDLVGRNFEKLVIGRNEQDIITFELTASREASIEISSSSGKEGE